MSPNELLVSGIGVVGGFGAGVDALCRFLSEPDAAAAVEEVTTPPGIMIQAFRADLAGLDRFADKRSLRRIDRYSRLAMLAAHLAVEDGGSAPPLGERTALVIASGHGATRSSFAFLDTVIDFGDPIASPTHFSASVHNAAAANVSMSLGLTGPNLTVAEGPLSLTAALLCAQRFLAEDAADEVLLGAVDEFCEIYALAEAEADPGCLARPSGEGAAFFRLSRSEGKKGRVGAVEAVAMGSGSAMLASDEDVPLLAGDGTPLPEGSVLLSLRERWGRFPTASGLDLAAALLAVSCRVRLPPPFPPAPGRVRIAEGGGDDGWGIVTVRGEAARR